MALVPQEHLAWILERIPCTPTRLLPLGEALGLILAEDLTAGHPLPLWANSAMDGYAVQAQQTTGACAQDPVSFSLVGEVAAGSAWDPPLGPGQAVRIMTGAPLPSQADAIVRVESTVGDDGPGSWASDHVQVVQSVVPGQEVRQRGEDVQTGQLLATAGDRLTAVRISALAAAGIFEVTVRMPPKVAVLVTGAELQPLGAPLGRGQIPESNSLLIQGLLTEAGISEIGMYRCPDDVTEVRARLAELGASYDVIVSTGGVGPGTKDVMRLALEEEPRVQAVRVAVRPGQPQCTGPLQSGAFIFALPGNPVSAAVSFELFVRPALHAMQGRSQLQRAQLTATAAVSWRGTYGRLQVLPVAFEPGEELRCIPAVSAQRISHSVGGFGAAQGYALIGPERGDVSVGERVSVIRIDS